MYHEQNTLKRLEPTTSAEHAVLLPWMWSVMSWVMGDVLGGKSGIFRRCSHQFMAKLGAAQNKIAGQSTSTIRHNITGQDRTWYKTIIVWWYIMQCMQYMSIICYADNMTYIYTIIHQHIFLASLHSMQLQAPVFSKVQKYGSPCCSFLHWKSSGPGDSATIQRTSLKCSLYALSSDRRWSQILSVGEKWQSSAM